MKQQIIQDDAFQIHTGALHVSGISNKLLKEANELLIDVWYSGIDDNEIGLVQEEVGKYLKENHLI